jgi:hypothetical protein
MKVKDEDEETEETENEVCKNTELNVQVGKSGEEEEDSD